MAYVGLSRRALRDIKKIETDSIQEWGHRIANDYLEAIESALGNLKENPGLLRENSDISEHLCFYRVKKHFLVCATVEKNIYVVTVKYVGMDLPNRIAELEPQLLQEAKILHRKLLKH